MVELLLDNGADANLSDQDGNTALLRACACNHPEVAKRLLHERPDVSVNATNRENLTPLMAAVDNSNLELMKILISYGANVNCSRISKFDCAGVEMARETTPLAVASACGSLEIVKALVENDAEVNSISETAFPPIAFAVLGGHSHVVEYLLNQDNFDASLSGLSQPLVLAVKCQSRECADLLIARYRGIDRLLEDAAQNSMHELLEHVKLYKQMACNAQGTPVPNPTPPLLQQITPPEAFTSQQLPQQQLTQQQQPPQTVATYSCQEEPLNDSSDEAINPLEINDSEELPPVSTIGTTSMQYPVLQQQTLAEGISHSFDHQDYANMLLMLLGHVINELLLKMLKLVAKICAKAGLKLNQDFYPQLPQFPSYIYPQR